MHLLGYVKTNKNWNFSLKFAIRKLHFLNFAVEGDMPITAIFQNIDTNFCSRIGSLFRSYAVTSSFSPGDHSLLTYI